MTSAANGDVSNCALILERERLKQSQQPAKPISTSKYVHTPRFATMNQSYTLRTQSPPIYNDMILTNFVSSGHTALQAAAQNGHVDVCNLLIGEFGADVEFEVLKVISCNFIFILTDFLQNLCLWIIYRIKMVTVLFIMQLSAISHELYMFCV